MLMPAYKAPVEDVLFLLNDVFHIERHNNVAGFGDATPDVVEAILVEAGKFCSEILVPLNRQGDIEGCTRHEDGRVTTPSGFKAAYDQMVAGGWIGISCPTEFGGQGLPATMTTVINEFLASSNLAFSMYSGLVQGAVAAIIAHGSDEQKNKFVPKMVEGVWAGTMNLTEPHCGTDLGLLTALTRSPARKSSFPAASRTSPKTSSISCSRASKARRPAPKAFRCSSCRR
jgi:alkylation response protein AidB-like acyl-CoA dehydrogenase